MVVEFAQEIAKVTSWPQLVAFGVLVASSHAPGWIASRRQKAVQDSVNEVVSQVANTHSTNLRDDLDKVLKSLDDTVSQVAAMAETQRSLAAQLQNIQQDIHLERRERAALTERVDRLVA